MKIQDILNEASTDENFKNYILKQIPVKSLYIANKTGDYDNIINGLQARRLINLRTVEVPELINTIKQLTKQRMEIENNTSPSHGIDDNKLFMYIDNMSKQEVVQLGSTVQSYRVLKDLESKNIIKSAMDASEEGNTTVDMLKNLINQYLQKKHNF